jgi:nitroreductase
MDVRSAIETRRSTKYFDPLHEMPESDIREILSLAMLSPTAFNIQHWRFVVATDRALREELRAVSWMQPQVTDASLLIVLCADLRAWSKQPERYWRNAPPDVREGVLAAIEAYYAGREQVARDEAMRSCGIAAQTLMLAARDLGYDSCPMDLSDLDAVGKVLRLPEDHAVAMFVAIGKGTRAPWARPGQLDFEEVVVRDRFAPPGADSAPRPQICPGRSGG